MDVTEKEGLDFAVPVFLSACAGRFGAKIRPLQLQRLAVSVPDGARRCPPRGRFGFKSFQQQIKRTINDGSFYLAEKEGFEPSRQLPDLHP